jgi:pimeloyl-ACP methyl ester carboxylesterase
VIHLTLFTPGKAKKPVPVFLLIDNRGPANTDPARKVKSEFWPVEEALARGYGMAVFNNADLDPDNFDDFKNGIHALLDKNPRQGDSWGTLAAWAWGASRCLDYLVTDKDVAGDKVAVVGHSRGGKTALWAGAEDQRFAMVVSNESGAGGAALARRRFGETVSRLNSAFPHWFCSNYKKYSDNEDALPVDMHMLLALTAPRALYVDCADEDLWGDPRGSYLSLYNAVPVFNLLGKNSTIPEAMPPLNKQIISGKVAFHIRYGVHNMLLKDWNWFMDFADVVLK